MDSTRTRTSNRTIAAFAVGAAVASILGGVAVASSGDGDDPIRPARLVADDRPATTVASTDDDGTPDQGPGDAPGTPGAPLAGAPASGDDDGTLDQGPGDNPPIPVTSAPPATAAPTTSTTIDDHGGDRHADGDDDHRGRGRGRGGDDDRGDDDDSDDDDRSGSNSGRG